MSDTTISRVQLGLRANWRQLAMLVVVNVFVGGMVGLERTVIPLIAEQDFGLISKTAALSFIVSFGVVKALTNLSAGGLGDRIGRKQVLVAGWLIGLPVPLLIIWAPSWGWIVLANVLLGVNQGLCWSMTVVMMIDLVGPEERGLTAGLNEFAGYGAVSLSALVAGYIAAAYALRPEPFYLGIAFALLGLFLSVFFVRETKGHATEEIKNSGRRGNNEGMRGTSLPFAQVFLLASWKERSLFAASQGGLITNLKDGMIWGLLPLFLTAAGLSVERIGVVVAVYPGVWGVGQLVTGPLSDRVGRKWMIAAGLWLQAVSIEMIVVVHSFILWMAAAALLGLGTALVYPTLLAAVSDVAQPAWRSSALGIYRLWRDGGYAVGALLSGVLADALGLGWAIGVVGGLTAISGLVVAMVMYETLGKAEDQL